MISATAPRSTSQATLITGLLGSGKTWSLTNQLLQAARAETSTTTCDPQQQQQGGTLLALSRQDNAADLRHKVDLDRPLGCAKCDVVTFPSLVRTIVNDFGPIVGSYTPADVRVLDRSSLCVFLHRHLDTLPLGKFRPLHDPGNAVRPILHLFSSLAHCGIAPEDYLRYVETLEAELEQTVAVEPHALEEEGLLAKGLGPEGARVGPSRAQLRAQLEGEAWREHVAGERDKANSYEAFVALKRREEVADHSDHLLLARRILKESATARTSLSLRLSHIFVDDVHEYSPAMLDILAGLAAPGVGITATADPLLAVTSAGVARGHPLGAEHLAVPRFKNAFPGTVEVRLAGNRQSTDAVRVAMEALEPRDAPVAAKNTKKKKEKEKGTKAVESEVSAAADAAAVEEPTSARQNETPTDSPVTEGSSRLSCLTFRSENDELKALGRRARELVDGGVRPGDIGVAAVGGWGTADVLSAALSASGVPVEEGSRFSSVFDSETPRMLMSFLRCLVHPSESTPLLHLLMHCPAYALPDGELTAALEGHLSRYVPLRSFLRDHLLGDGRGADPRGGGGVSADVARVAGKILSDVDRFAGAAKKNGVREVMRDFLRYTGQLEQLEEPSTAKEEREGRAVAELFELAVMAEKQAEGDNVALVEPVLRLFRRHGVGYTEEDPSSYFQEGGAATDTEDAPGGGVTVFDPSKGGAAAGRSFHTVFIPFCTRTRLPGNLRKARLPVPGPFLGAPEPRDAASIRAEADLTRVCHENRARANLYAAVASARKEVCLSVSARVSRGRTHLAPSPFISEILGASAPQEWKAAAPKEDGVAVTDAASGRVEVSPLDAEGGEREGGGRTRSLRLSFSSISSLAACPHSYYLQHVLNVSPPPNPRMVYGRAMHEAVASFLRGAVGGGGGGGGGGSGGGGSPPTLEAAVQEFKHHFNGCAFESSAQVKTLTENGVVGLASFLSRLLEGGACAAPVRLEGGEGGDEGTTLSKVDLRTQLLVERKFMVKVPESDVVLSGIFDRVDVAPTSVGGALGPPVVSITDYKSNVGTKDPSRMVQDNLQLRLYSLAAERLFGVMPAEAVIESIEDGRRGVAVPSQADAELALAAISVAAAAVRAEKFDATPSFQACTFCGFKHMCRHSLAPNSAL